MKKHPTNPTAFLSRGFDHYRRSVAVLMATFSMARGTPALPELVRRGDYLSRAGDCISCHTAPKGQPFAGGLPLKTPLGVIYSTNITPDPETGIGRLQQG